MKTSRTRRMLSHLWRVLVRAIIATLILWLVVAFPLPSVMPQLLTAVRMPLAVFFFIIYIGKLLYDTLFYDRYL